MLNESITKRLVLSRYLFTLAENNSLSQREVEAFACVILLQDSLETFLLAAVEHLNVSLKPRTEFIAMFNTIDEKLSAKPLPFRKKISEINRIRVLAKHEGIKPDISELAGYTATVRLFFNEASLNIFEIDFWTISLLNLLDATETRELLQQAQGEFQNEQYAESLTSCRKALFIEFEASYDVNPSSGNFSFLFSSAPYYTRTPEWVADNVKTPFDYIALDHTAIDRNLTKEGIDHSTFWNVWRLTPRVYRSAKMAKWAVMHEPAKFEQEGLKNRAAYVLENMIDIVLRRALWRRSLRWIGSDTNYVIYLKQAGAQVYRKADKASEIMGRTPPDILQLKANFGTPGLNDVLER